MKRTRLARLAGILALFALAGVVVVLLLVRPALTNWGATEEEIHKPLTGDDLAQHASIQRTKALTIQAPAHKVFAWLVQMGQDRAGLYSYEFIENMVLGCDIHNSNRIVPEWQNTRPGDLMRMYPADKSGPPPYIYAHIEPNRAVILGHQDAGKTRWTDSWQFVLEPAGENTTRLIVRTRSESMGIWDVLDTAYSFMERGMLLGIQERAEALAQ